MTRTQLVKIVFAIIALATLAPVVPAWAALLLGLTFALAFGNPFAGYTRKTTPPLLQLSVIGLGAGMNLVTVAAVGASGVVYTIVGIASTLVVGYLLGRALGTERVTGFLVSCGTAICGGSAIAALAPVVRAKDHEMSVSLATVFFLNASALIIFPPLGHWAGFDERQFGLWAALAIHDTSSVVGAAMQYGPRALEIATTVKLARALWIVPLALGTAAVWSRTAQATPSEGAGKPRIKIPWFILGFIAAAALVTWVPVLAGAGELVATAAKRSLVLTLFLIGSGLSRQTLKAVGVRPFLHGLALWMIVGSLTFLAIAHGLIS